MDFSKVTEVLGVATKKDGSEIRGFGKNGEWIMYSVILEDGKKLNVFGPVKVGDVVYELKQDPQYHTWQGKVKPAGSTIAPNNPVQDMSQPTNAQIMEAVRKTYALVLEVQKKLNEELSTEPYADQTPDEPEVLPDDAYDGEPVDIKTLNIPF